MWYIKYKNGDILHFNPNHDPSNGQFSEGKGGAKSFWNKDFKSLSMTDLALISGGQIGVLALKNSKKKKISNKIAEATNNEETKYIENEDGVSGAVINKIHNSFKNGNSAAQNAVYENLKERPLGKDLDIDTVKRCLKKPDEIRVFKAPKGNFGVATYYGGKPGTKEYEEFSEAFSNHIIDVEFDADTGKILRVSADG